MWCFDTAAPGIANPLAAEASNEQTLRRVILGANIQKDDTRPFSDKKRIAASAKGDYDQDMMLSDERCWDAVTKRNAQKDGQFYFGVLTTGVYCRPSCPAKQPLRKNVRFYEFPGDAERAGLRPCKRCHPLAGRADEAAVEKIRNVCTFIQAHCESGEDLTLEVLAQESGWSAFHLHRTFKAVLGITPKQLLDACRVSALKKQLKHGSTVTNAVYQAGFGSSSRVYENVDKTLGMTPAQYKDGGKNVDISYAYAQTSLGLLLAAATARGLCFVQFGESIDSLMAQLKGEFPQAKLSQTNTNQPEMTAWMDALTKYLQGEPAILNLPIDVKASVFQLKVWRYLQTIPRGETRTYGEVANAIGDPAASRAVGTACGSNQIALVIPCHRVIRGDKSLGGYRWGLERKAALLAAEKPEAEKKRYTARQR
jgi:AraC family transcriptional regulator, regulatory protein of adaptative response / methylated-DNA-[protein]-cysteine methyltransferase